MAKMYVQFEEGRKGKGPMTRLWERGGEWQTNGRGRWVPAVIANNFNNFQEVPVKAGEVWEVEVDAEIKDRDNPDRIRLVLLKPLRQCPAGVVDINFNRDTLKMKGAKWELSLEAREDKPLMPLASWKHYMDSRIDVLPEWCEFIKARKDYLETRLIGLEREREEKLAFLAKPPEEILFDVRAQENTLIVETCEGSWTLGAEDYKGTLSIVPRGTHHDFSDMGPVLASFSGFEVKTVGGVPVNKLPRFLHWDKIVAVTVTEIESRIKAYFEAEVQTIRWEKYEWPVTYGAHSEKNLKELGQELKILNG